MKKFLCIPILIFLVQNIALAQSEPRKIKPPKKIEYDSKIYRYDPSWEDKDTYLETNLDEDEDNEIIISFMGSFKPEIEDKREDYKPFTREKKEIAIIKHQAFYQIYDKGLDGYYQPVRTFTGMDQSGRIELIELDGYHPKAIAIYSPGGRDYLDLSIYLWQEGGYRQIFTYGGPRNISIDTHSQPISVVCKKDGVQQNNIVAKWDKTTSSFR
ncbi:MAG: hypothetical protein ABIC68_00155 [Candidatus Omnitrophota bacterium]